MALTAIPRDATKGIGGIKYVLLTNFADVDVTVDQATGLITFEKAGGGAVEAGTFIRFDFPKESSNYTVTGTGTPNQGTTFYAHVLTMVFKKNEAAKRNVVQVMGQSELIAVVVDRNGNNFCLGYENGLDLTANVGGSGTAPADLNGQTVTLTGNEPNPEAVVEDSELALIEI